jgi:hypothetical protein
MVIKPISRTAKKAKAFDRSSIRSGSIMKIKYLKKKIHSLKEDFLLCWKKQFPPHAYVYDFYALLFMISTQV